MYESDAHETGSARIKQEYLVSVHQKDDDEPPVKKVKLDSTVVNGDTNADDDVEQRTAPVEDETRQKRKGGQNKPKDRPRKHVVEKIQLCSAAAQGETCKREECRFTHDIAEFMAERAPDVGDRCPHFSTFGRCPFAVRCLYSQHHSEAAPSYRQLIDETKVGNAEYITSVTTLNGITRDLQNLLRKKQFPFTKANAYVKALNERGQVSQRKKTNGVETGVVTDIDANTQEINAQPVVATHKLTPREKKRLEFHGKSYLAPLTTVGNLPFRRLCKKLGVDITCGEMALSHQLVMGTHAEWALLKRHPSEDFFGVQIAGQKPIVVTQACELMMNGGPNGQPLSLDFVDLNLGCPVDSVFKSGSGSALLERPGRIGDLVRGMDQVLECPVTIKMRTGVQIGKNTAHNLIPQLAEWNVVLATLHGRSRNQRYKALADWDYINKCAELKGDRMALFGNGDIMSYAEYNEYLSNSAVDGIMIGRGALIKPWIFTEIKEQRHWDISSRERFDLLREFVNFGLEHWGSDTQGLNTTRRFLMEQLSFSHRYIPIGLLEVIPQKINERPPKYYGRDDLETLMASDYVGDWIKLSEMLLGPADPSFKFLPKHKSNSYEG